MWGLQEFRGITTHSVRSQCVDSDEQQVERDFVIVWNTMNGRSEQERSLDGNEHKAKDHKWTLFHFQSLFSHKSTQHNHSFPLEHEREMCQIFVAGTIFGQNKLWGISSPYPGSR